MQERRLGKAAAAWLCHVRSSSLAAQRPAARPACRSGDNAPAFALGQLAVARGRYTVTYRLVNSVYVMVVAQPAANAFLLLQLLEVRPALPRLICNSFSLLPQLFVECVGRAGSAPLQSAGRRAAAPAAAGAGGVRAARSA